MSPTRAARLSPGGVASSRRYLDRQIPAYRVHLHQQNPATATLAAFSSAMGRYSASRHPLPRATPSSFSSSSSWCSSSSSSSASSVFYPYTPAAVSVQPLPSFLSHTHLRPPSCRSLVPVLPTPTSSAVVSTSSSFSSDRLYLPAALYRRRRRLGGLVHRCTG